MPPPWDPRRSVTRAPCVRPALSPVGKLRPEGQAGCAGRSGRRHAEQCSDPRCPRAPGLQWAPQPRRRERGPAPPRGGPDASWEEKAVTRERFLDRVSELWGVPSSGHSAGRPRGFRGHRSGSRRRRREPGAEAPQDRGPVRCRPGWVGDDYWCSGAGDFAQFPRKRAPETRVQVQVVFLGRGRDTGTGGRRVHYGASSCRGAGDAENVHLHDPS